MAILCIVLGLSCYSKTRILTKPMPKREELYTYKFDKQKGDKKLADIYFKKAKLLSPKLVLSLMILPNSGKWVQRTHPRFSNPWRH